MGRREAAVHGRHGTALQQRVIRSRAAERLEVPRAGVHAEVLQRSDDRRRDERAGHHEQQLAAMWMQAAGARYCPARRRERRKNERRTHGRSPHGVVQHALEQPMVRQRKRLTCVVEKPACNREIEASVTEHDPKRERGGQQQQRLSP